MLQIEATFEVDANGEKSRLFQSDIVDRTVQEGGTRQARVRQAEDGDREWLEDIPCHCCDTRRRSPRDVFERRDKEEKFDTFTEKYPNEDEYGNAAAAHHAESADLDVSIEAHTRAIAALSKVWLTAVSSRVVPAMRSARLA